MTETCTFFSNTKCEYFPCHAKADKTAFNCLFCFCPLYFFGEGCGGDFTYTQNGVKDCTNCTLPHNPHNYKFVITKLKNLTNSNSTFAQR